MQRVGDEDRLGSNGKNHFRPFARCGHNIKLSTDELCPFAHSHQAEMPGSSQIVETSGNFKSFAIIANSQGGAGCFKANLNGNPMRLGVA